MTKLKELILRFKNNDSTFFCSLPCNFGKIKSFFLRRIFSGIEMKQEQVNIVKNLPQDAIVVFVVKYKSRFEFLFANIRHRQLGLPTPRLGFDYNMFFFQPLSRFLKICSSHLSSLVCNRKIPNPYNTDYYKKILLDSKCALLSLVEKRGFYLRFVKKKHDPLNYLIEIQKEIKKTIYIVPQLMFFDRKPLSTEPSLTDIFFGNSQQPSILRKIFVLAYSPKKIFVEVSQPLNLKHWIKQTSKEVKQVELQALTLRRQLLLQHNRHRHTITGPTLKSKEEVKESILTNKRMRIFMKEHAQIEQIPLHKVRKKADSYINEIAAAYNPGYIKIMSHVISWIINSTFDGAVVDKKGLRKVREISQQGPLILVPCHKSHVDYLVLSYTLYHNNMPCPHVAAGKNLSFWPLGAIFRSGGAFFIRRTFKGQELYAKVFSEYVRKLLEEGFNIEIFIEGGRSRTGKLLTPKLGLISILLDAFKSGICEDMFFVPVYIGYDRIIEEHAYIHETGGGKKKPENFSQVIRARKFLKKRYGKIYINFNNPISAKEMIYGHQYGKKEHIKLCQDVGRRIITAIDRGTVITPHGLTAAAILNFPRKRFTRKEIINIANSYLLFATSQAAKLADTLTISSDKAFENAFNEYKERKLLEEVHNDNCNSPNEMPHIVKNNKRSLLEFYKNNSISYFIHGAIVAITILEKDAFQFSSYNLHKQHKTLTGFFKYEFAVDLEKSSEYFVRKTIKAFIDDAMLMPHRILPDTYKITSSGYQKLKLYAGFLKPYFESYLVVLLYLKKTTREKIEKINSREQVKKIQILGTQMYKRKDIDLIESISKNNYLNGINLFLELESNISKKINCYQDFIQNNLKLISR